MIIFRYILRIIRNSSDKTYREATFGSMITNDPRYTCEIKSRIGQKEDSFHQQTGLTFQEENSDVPHLHYMMLKLGHFRKQIRNTSEVLK
jgi:hypothetical protein